MTVQTSRTADNGPDGPAPARAVRDLPYARTGDVRLTGDRSNPYEVTYRGEADRRFSHVLVDAAAEHAPLTVLKYAYGLLVLSRYERAFGVDLARWTRVECRDMVRHLQVADNPQRTRSVGSELPPPGTLLVSTGKRYLPAGYSPRYINGLLVPARAFFEWYAEFGGPVLNPVPPSGRVETGGAGANAGRAPDDPYRRPARGRYRQQVHEALPRRIRPDHLDSLRAACRTARDEAMFAVLEETGVRASELVTLPDSNLDRDAHLANVYGKGLRGHTREVPFSDRVFDLIHASRRELAERHGVRPGPSDPLFWTLHSRTPAPLNYNALRGWFRNLAVRSDLNYTLHDMRHTAAFRMVDSGLMTLPQVQKVLGHRHITTTQLYTRPTHDETVTAISRWWSDMDESVSHGFDIDAVGHLDADDLAEVFGELL